MSFPNLSALAVRERGLTLFFLLLSVFGGVWAFVSLGRAEDPAFTVRVLVVSAFWPGASAQQMQDLVADPLEKRLGEVEYFYKLETTLRAGRLDILMEFQDYTPSERIAEPLLRSPQAHAGRGRQAARRGAGALCQRRLLGCLFRPLCPVRPRSARRGCWSARPRGYAIGWQRVPGVQKARVLGERPQRVFVELDNARLANLGLTPAAIRDALDAQNRLLPAGRVETAGPRLYPRLDATNWMTSIRSGRYRCGSVANCSPWARSPRCSAVTRTRRII
jgi:hypothetical protein